MKNKIFISFVLFVIQIIFFVNFRKLDLTASAFSFFIIPVFVFVLAFIAPIYVIKESIYVLKNFESKIKYIIIIPMVGISILPLCALFLNFGYLLEISRHG